MTDRKVLRTVKSATATIVICGLFLSGCAGILDPHPRATALSNFKIVDAVTPATERIEFGGRLPEAIDAAEAQRLQYVTAGGNISIYRNAGIATIVAMSAGALYLGVTSSSRSARDATAALGIAGAGLFGLGNVFLSNSRQRLYYRAAEAVGCAVWSMSPFLVRKESYVALSDALSNFNSERSNVEFERDALADLIEQLQNITQKLSGGNKVKANETTTKALDAITKANRALSEGKQTEKAGNLLKDRVDDAHVTLITFVRNIADIVDQQIGETEPDFSSVQSILSGIPGIAGQIAPGGKFVAKLQEVTGAAAAPKALASPEEIAASLVNQISTQMHTLEHVLINFANITEKIRTPVETFQAKSERVKTTITDCKAPTVDIKFAVFPSEDDQEAVAGGKDYIFTIHDETPGAGSPTATILKQTPANVSIEVKLGNRGDLIAQLTAPKEAAGQAIEIQFRSRSGNQEKFVKLTFKAAPAETPQPAAKTGAQPLVPQAPKPAPLTADITELKALTKLQLMTLQAYLQASVSSAAKLSIDGIWGDKTATAVTNFRKEQDLQPEEKTWAKVNSLLTMLRPTPEGRVSEGKGMTKAVEKFEEGLKGTDIQKLQTALRKLGDYTPGAFTGEFDLETRKAIFSFQKREKLPETGTILAAKIFDEILKKSA